MILHKLNLIYNPDTYSEKALEELCIDYASMSVTREGWIVVRMSWDSSDEKFRHCTYDGYGFGYGDIEVRLEFPEVPAPLDEDDKNTGEHKAILRVGIENPCIDADGEQEQMKYQFSHFEWTKYGCFLYFMPPGALRIEETLQEFFDNKNEDSE